MSSAVGVKAVDVRPSRAARPLGMCSTWVRGVFVLVEGEALCYLPLLVRIQVSAPAATINAGEFGETLPARMAPPLRRPVASTGVEL
jgi:hypothetical protein